MGCFTQHPCQYHTTLSSNRRSAFLLLYPRSPLPVTGRKIRAATMTASLQSAASPQGLTASLHHTAFILNPISPDRTNHRLSRLRLMLLQPKRILPRRRSAGKIASRYLISKGMHQWTFLRSSHRILQSRSRKSRVNQKSHILQLDGTCNLCAASALRLLLFVIL